LSRQSIADLIVHTKNVTPQGHVFAKSFEQRTENPRVGNPAITPVNMHSEGFDLIGSFLCLRFLCGRHYSCLLFSLRGLKDVAFGYAFITMAQLRFCEE
jgi:hypothetical protein